MISSEGNASNQNSDNLLSWELINSIYHCRKESFDGLVITVAEEIEYCLLRKYCTDALEFER
jgi:hypothetical protein